MQLGVMFVRDETTFQKAIQRIRANTPDLESIIIKSRLNQGEIELIVKSLSKNSVVRILSFSEGGVRDQLLQEMAKLIPLYGTPTETLYFGISNLDGGTSVAAFANTLTQPTRILSSSLNNNLINLQFSRCSIGDVGAMALAKGLTRNTTIKYVHLNQNNIGDDGACAIGEMLLVNRTIKCLVLRKNKITNVGVQVICNALQVQNNRSTLKLLLFNFNRISCDGAIAIGKMLQTNDTLMKLDVSHNRIGDEGKCAIMDAVTSHNYNIESINVGCGFPVKPLEMDVQTKIHFYTDFNKMGNRKILKEHKLNVALWPYIFAKFGRHHKDLHPTFRLSILYNYVMSKPELFKPEI